MHLGFAAITYFPLIIQSHGILVDVNLAGERNLTWARPLVVMRVGLHCDLGDGRLLSPKHLGEIRNHESCDYKKLRIKGPRRDIVCSSLP